MMLTASLKATSATPRQELGADSGSVDGITEAEA
jgi:hypothetical protein